MGWTGYIATHFTKSGQVDRKAECNAYFEEGLNRGNYKVVKSRMVGSVYYGAIISLKRTKKDMDGKVMKDPDGSTIYEIIPELERTTFGMVFLTSVRNKDIFSYKPISEDMGPCYYDCPKSILDILSPTDNEYAKNWREKCYANLKKPSLSKLPIGTEIQFKWNGKMITLRKSAPRYQFKTCFWVNDADLTYFSKKLIPKDFVILPS